MVCDFSIECKKMIWIRWKVTWNIELNTEYLCISYRSTYIFKNQKRNSSVEDAISYFDLMASSLDELRRIQNHIRERIRCD